MTNTNTLADELSAALTAGKAHFDDMTLADRITFALEQRESAHEPGVVGVEVERLRGALDYIAGLGPDCGAEARAHAITTLQDAPQHAISCPQHPYQEMAQVRDCTCGLSQKSGEQLSASEAASFDKTLARSPRRIQADAPPTLAPDWRSQKSSEPQTPKEAPKPGVRCQVTYRGKQCCRPDGHDGEHIATGASANMRW